MGDERKRGGGEGTTRVADQGPEDSRLLRPANQGHDEERQRDQQEAWDAQQPHGSRARLHPEEDRERAAAAPFGEEPTGEAEAPRVHGSPHNAKENRREHHVGGGEPRKHPRPPEATTPPPAASRHPAHTVPGEPPDVNPTAGGFEYTPGFRPRKG